MREADVRIRIPDPPLADQSDPTFRATPTIGYRQFAYLSTSSKAEKVSSVLDYPLHEIHTIVPMIFQHVKILCIKGSHKALL